MEQLSDRQTHWFNIIENSLDRIDELSGSILEYERIAAGIELNKQSHDLNIIAQKVVSDYESLAAEKAHQLILKTASTPLPINGDELLLRQALSNIIANAVKYTPDGGQITAHTARVGDEYVVAVQDSGPGIGSKELSKVFQPFFRLKSTTRSKGSGLGLSLTKMIVERHGGRVMVESVLNEGSVFTMYLPAK